MTQAAINRKDTDYQPVFISDIQIAKRHDVHRATVWRWARTSDFPKPIKLSNRCSRWRLDEIEAWEALK